MQEILQNSPDEEPRKPPPLNILLGALVVVAIGLAFWLAFKSPPGASSRAGASSPSIPMTPAEQVYVQSMRIESIALSRAENFIHQEVIILNADAVNSGQQPVSGLGVTVQFFDDLHQVVLRESRNVLAAPAFLAPGQRRSFTVSFDRVPASWNYQQPSVQVTYLRLGTLK
jgi:hypothetical protein